MKKIMPGHLTGFGSVKEVYDLENFADDDMFTDAGLTVIRDWGLTTKECEELCRRFSGEVKVCNTKPANRPKS